MVLTCDGVKVGAHDATSVDYLFEAYPMLKSKADALSKRKKKSVKPDGVLYARQKVSSAIDHLTFGKFGLWGRREGEGMN